MKKLLLLILAALPAFGAPANKTLNLSIYSTSRSPAGYEPQLFNVSGNNGKVLGISNGEWALIPQTGGSGSSEWGAITGTITDQDDLVSAFALKAPLASPTFTGTVTLPNSTVTNAMLAGSITAAKLVGTDLTLASSQLTSGTIADARLSANLAAISAQTTAANKLTYWSGSGTAALLDFTAAGRALLDDADAAAQRTTLGLGAAAILATSTGGNGAGDSGKAAIFNASGAINLPAFWDYGAGNMVEVLGDDLAGDTFFQWPVDGGKIATQEWATSTFGGGVDTGANFTWTGTHDYTGATVSFGTLGVTTLNATGLELGGTAITPTGTELNYVDGVTSAIQTQLNTKITASSTDALTNKSIDASDTGNNIKLKGYIYLTHPHYVDGTGATLTTTATSVNYGHATFSNSADQAANYVEYQFQVPEDLNTGVDLRARIKFVLGNTDTAAHRFVLSSVSVADSAVPASATLANAVNVDVAGDGSGAASDMQTSAWTTLTGWRSALTAGQTWRIRFARDGDDGTNDASTVDCTERGLVIEYGISQ